MSIRKRLANAAFAASLSLLILGQAAAGDTDLNYNAGTHWLSGGTTTYVGDFDTQYCSDWQNVDLIANRPWDWWSFDVYDGSNDGYMWLCYRRETTRYGAAVAGSLWSPISQVYSNSTSSMGEIAQVPFGATATSNGIWTAYGSHSMLESTETCDLQYWFNMWPNPTEYNCNNPFPYSWSIGGSSDYVEVTNL